MFSPTASASNPPPPRSKDQTFRRRRRASGQRRRCSTCASSRSSCADDGAALDVELRWSSDAELDVELRWSSGASPEQGSGGYAVAPSSSCLHAGYGLALVGVAGLSFHITLTYVLIAVLGWGLPGAAAAAAAYDISLWTIALGQAAYIVGWCRDDWQGWSMAAFNDMWALVRLSLESAVMLCLEIWYMGMHDHRPHRPPPGCADRHRLAWHLHECQRMGGYDFHWPQRCYQRSSLH